MLRRNRHERHTHDGVGTRGEHVHLAVLNRLACGVGNVVREREANAFRFSDPVFLHRTHAIRPAFEEVRAVGVCDRVKQLLRVIRDLQVVAGNLAFHDQRTRTPTATIDHLFIGEHGLIDRIPVHDLGLAIRDALFEHLQEQPLVPLVIVRRTDRHLARPVNGEPHRLHLLLHVRDVFVCPLRDRHLVFHRGVFGGQAERVPAHRLQHVVAAHAQLPIHHVVDRVVAHVAHMQLAGGIRQH